MDDARIRALRDMTSGWIVQKEISSCLPTCLTNILADASRHRYNHDKIGYTYGQVCRAVGYSPKRGTPRYDAIEGLTRKLAGDKHKQWSVKSKYGKELTVEEICSTTASEKCSFPIVSLGAEYICDHYSKKLEGYPQTWPERRRTGLR
ncbi:MAG: hypothetical protein LBS92_03615 [Candidatus Methanoplasma sp.]|jgi:hypothetical protein|nr:hypothetical protein [Candidatus Methanoplasma sp.]